MILKWVIRVLRMIQLNFLKLFFGVTIWYNSRISFIIYDLHFEGDKLNV